MSRFVSGGTSEESTSRDEAWLKAQADLDAKHVAEQVAARSGGEGKSLFETLQANKAAKQDAFEESMRLKNQFRSLDEDEVEFLDNVMELERARDEEVRVQNRQQLEAFKAQREDAEKAAKLGEAEDVVAKETWFVAGGRKRKKGKDNEGLSGLKVRRTSSTAGAQGETKREDSIAQPVANDATTASASTLELKSKPTSLLRTASSATTPPTAALGLAAYSSDEDD